MKVPFLEISREAAADLPDINRILSSVAESGTYLFGPRLEQFESDLAASLTLPADRVVACHSGTDALTLALLTAGVGPGDEVITPANTAAATAAAIVCAGAEPVFCDVRPDDWLLDIESCLASVTARTKGVIPVHLYGNAFDALELRRRLAGIGRQDIFVIEDAAQAQGALFRDEPVGTHGQFGAFSFYPTKNLAALGDGGALVCELPAHALDARALRFYGQEKKNMAKLPRGINSRMDEMQAGVLSFRLKRMAERLARKSSLQQQYDAAFRGLPLRRPAIAAGCTPAWHLYVVELESDVVREGFCKFLQGNGISTLVHYPRPLHQQPAFMRDRRPRLPVVEGLAGKIVSLPFSAFHTPAEAEWLQQTVISFFR